MLREAILLGGGLGTRLRSVLPEAPKIIAPVGGRPFVTYVLDQLRDAGIARTVIATGYRAEQVRDTLGTAYRGMQLDYSEEPSPMGTAGAMRYAVGAGAVSTPELLVLNGDSFVDANFGAFYEWHQKHGRHASILLTHVEDTARFGTVDVDDQDRVTSFREKCGVAEPGWINSGVYLFSRNRIAELPGNGALSLEREVLPQWLCHGMGAYRSRSPFLDIGTPETLEAASAFFASVRRARSSASDS